MRSVNNLAIDWRSKAIARNENTIVCKSDQEGIIASKET
jgi:hypothetical protein